MRFLEFIKFLGVFVVGSLLLTWIVSPQTLYPLTNSVGDVVAKFKVESKTASETFELVPSEMEEYFIYKSYYRSCANIEAIGESTGISDMKQKVCREACGKRNMDYYSYGCTKDLLTCYCIS